MNWIKKRQAESAQPATDNAESVQPQRLTSDVNTFLASFDSLLHKIANKYKGALVDHDDLVQEARIAIANAMINMTVTIKPPRKLFFQMSLKTLCSMQSIKRTGDRKSTYPQKMKSERI